MRGSSHAPRPFLYRPQAAIDLGECAINDFDPGQLLARVSLGVRSEIVVGRVCRCRCTAEVGRRSVKSTALPSSKPRTVDLHGKCKGHKIRRPGRLEQNLKARWKGYSGSICHVIRVLSRHVRSPALVIKAPHRARGLKSLPAAYRKIFPFLYNNISFLSTPFRITVISLKLL